MNDEWDDDSWDGVWQGRVKRDGQGWTCEMRIPFSQDARSRLVTPMVWGVNLPALGPRGLQRAGRAVVYHAARASPGATVSRFPERHGLDGVHPRGTRSS
jgi:hypothetical protein